MIRFSKYIWVYFVLSSLVLVPGILSLIRFGLRPSVDFTGGTLIEAQFPGGISKPTIETIAQGQKIALASVQKSGETTYLLRMKPTSDELLKLFEDKLASASGAPMKISRTETVGPILGKELLTKAVAAALFAICVILLYVAYAFKNIKFGVSAIVALLHDLLVVLGCFSLLGHFWGVEVDTLFVTAFLTTMSFSVHDTIVVFDRIREYRRRDDRTPFVDISDRALTETVGRSLANSLTIIFMLLSLVLLGGETTKWFVVALLIGTISGAYSSPFIATPVLILWDKWERKKRA